MLNADTPDVRLDEYDENEMWDIARAFKPDLSREVFDSWWKELVTDKGRKFAKI